ncbi:iron uptake system protein EfeO [Lacisediminihabitans changchengi]|uniref:Peptidase M75 family protein n=1 Tax=Lacisediminihabitans changchengi TaxID=2787634 RepID=A0A934W2Y4_9MICO|nr:iron uptake system protein EfeO [Lacisediminihabitans changchengi]MBK4347326.1 peptidase M75 family protein [Lacisediminihabitans changchengi]
MKYQHLIAGAAAAGALALILTGCVPNNQNASSGASATTVNVAASDNACDLSATTAPSGAITFTISNSGSDVSEFEIVAEDKLRIIGEKENVGPGTTPKYVAQLEPGTYYTSCKPGMVGAGVGETKFTVTDSGAKIVPASDKKAIAGAVAQYVSYAKDQVGELVTDTQTFVAAFESGDVATAKKLYPAARAHYERIEPLAEKFPDLDTDLDIREADLDAGATWTGWHRMEKDLWAPAGYTPLTADERKTLGDKLNSDTKKLYELFYDTSFSVTLGDVSNGAIALMDEVATGKITGEEETFSHTDLWDFQANIEGAKVSFENVRDIAEGKGAAGKKLVSQIDADFATLSTTLGQYGSLDSGYALYNDLSTDQIKQLSDQVNALAEPLSKLTAVVLK